MDFGREKKTPWPGDPAGQDQAQDGQDEAQDRQDAAQDGQDEAQDGQDGAPGHRAKGPLGA